MDIENRISGRYITQEMIIPILEEYEFNNVTLLGHSVQGRPISLYQLGKGNKKILLWSQMHGNESTTTKALFDVLKFFTNVNNDILNKVSIFFIPMLNPDGAALYTRNNANDVDLNRDAFLILEPESQCLRKAYELVKPDFCFNLHDQRTIFSAGKNDYPATISFLAPSFNEERELNETRKKAMEVINVTNNNLQKYIKNQIARFDDGFNINCTGDFFTAQGIPTILFEAGHYQNDYIREKTRVYVALAIKEAIFYICNNEVIGTNFEGYFSIPENQKLYFDILITNDFEKNADIGILYKEVLKDSKINFEPYIAQMGDLSEFYGHRKEKLSTFFTKKPTNQEINNLINSDLFLVR